MADLGSDIAGVLDLDSALSVVSGPTALAHAILRRLTTRRGGLIGSVTYGYDLRAVIGSAVPASVVEQRVREQCLLEEEVEDARAEATVNAQTGALEILVSVVLSTGPFELTITLQSDLTIDAFVDGVQVLGERQLQLFGEVA